MSVKSPKISKNKTVADSKDQGTYKTPVSLSSYKFDTSTYTHLPSPVRRDADTGRLVLMNSKDKK